MVENDNVAVAARNSIARMATAATATPVIEPVYQNEVNSVIRSGRNARSVNLVAADFSSQSVIDDFETPAVLRRQGLNHLD